ncbi:MAG TPA: hypothetical protein VK927_03485 [Adhaeribacter sp.]|nr:hypothetical protein [Adhaeribacter sp.]
MKKKFREKTFIDFIKEQGLPAVFWIMFVFCAILAAGVAVLELNQGRFPSGAIFLLCGPVGLILFFNSYAFAIYKKGEKLFNSEAYRSAIPVEHVKVNIKNFDLMERKDFIPFVSKTIYDFDEADILLNDKAIMLLGKGNFIFGKTYVAPVELTLGNKWSYLNHARIKAIGQLPDGSPELLIQDPNYKNEIKIVLENRDEIKQWVAQAKQELVS